MKDPEFFWTEPFPCPDTPNRHIQRRKDAEKKHEKDEAARDEAAQEKIEAELTRMAG